MATVSITIPDTLVPRLTAAMHASFPQYAGMTDAAWFKQVTADFWRSVLVTYETSQAQDTATATVLQTQTQAQTDGAGIG